MRRSILLLATVLLLMLAGLPAASAHVHGVTPLLQCGVDNANSGGNGTNGTPADDDVGDSGGPITGLIPRDTGNGAIGFGDGGFGATGTHCP